MNKNTGQAVLVMLIILAPAAVLIAFSTNFLTLINKKSAANFVYSLNSYYAAEAGIEDSLLRLTRADLDHQSSTTLTLGSASAQVTIADNTTTVNVTADGNAQNRRRRLAVTLNRNTTGASFFYGVQVGAGGLTMINHAKVIGNVYSNSTIDGDNDAEITGDAWVAGANTLDEITVGLNAHANTINKSAIGVDAYYQTINKTSVGGTSHPGSPNPTPAPLPISDEQITDWQAAAAVNEVSTVTLENDDVVTLGPVKINGNLVIEDDAQLTITGTIWVTGNVTLKNNAVIQLSPAFGALSGVLVADGRISVDNNVLICGSEGYNAATDECRASNQTYLLLLSTHTSLDKDNPAIFMKNGTALRGLIYAHQGIVTLENNTNMNEVTGYAMHIRNNATVTYQSGLANSQFSTGPAGGFSITQWQEIE